MPRLLAASLVAASLVVTSACLGPRVSDMPGASANILPSDATIQPVAQNADLLNQITLNDSLDTKALMPGGVIQRGTGASNGTSVMYWAFGDADRAPAPIYLFGTGDPTKPSFQPFPPDGHLPLVEAVPGDAEYEPIHTIYNVAVTERYHGEKITTMGALADAIEIGLVQEPVATKIFVNWPIVRPGLRLEVGGTAGTKPPTPLYAHGYIVDSFPLGGMYSMQPDPFGLLPTSQVSFLREPQQPTYDSTRPIFQATIPTSQSVSYTPVSIVINVDLTTMGAAAGIHGDGDLFTRSSTTGAITGTKPIVLQFTVTADTLDLQLQYGDGVQ